MCSVNSMSVKSVEFQIAKISCRDVNTKHCAEALFVKKKTKKHPHRVLTVDF